MGRKNWLFAGSVDGGKAVAAWLSVIQSARLHEVEPWAYVKDLLTKLATYREMTPQRRMADGDAYFRKLLPQAWLKANPATRLPLGRCDRVVRLRCTGCAARWGGSSSAT